MVQRNVSGPATVPADSQAEKAPDAPLSYGQATRVSLTGFDPRTGKPATREAQAEALRVLADSIEDDRAVLPVRGVTDPATGLPYQSLPAHRAIMAMFGQSLGNLTAANVRKGLIAAVS